MESILQFMATILVALISLIGILIQQRNKNKTDSIDQKIDKLRKEQESRMLGIENKIDDNQLAGLKRFLIIEMTKIQQSKKKTGEEQKRIIYEAKKEYNDLGGDSYVDDMFEDLRKNDIL